MGEFGSTAHYNHYLAGYSLNSETVPNTAAYDPYIQDVLNEVSCDEVLLVGECAF
jgi:hypothetical protein